MTHPLWGQHTEGQESSLSPQHIDICCPGWPLARSAAVASCGHVVQSSEHGFDCSVWLDCRKRQPFLAAVQYMDWLAVNHRLRGRHQLASQCLHEQVHMQAETQCLRPRE